MFGLTLNHENFDALMRKYKAHNEVGLVLRLFANDLLGDDDSQLAAFGSSLSFALDRAYKLIQEADAKDEATNKAKLDALEEQLLENAAAQGRTVEKKYEH